ncbi:MAG: amino acid amidase [Spirochaetaceae bacterium]|nr:MAG: amino acid amidase [Spirochaetaceae bacterium]
MNKLYVSVDIEGVCGIVDWKETEIDEAQGAYFRSEMSDEAATVCRAAVAAGIDSIFVKDAHDSGRSIDPSVLPEEASLMRAWTKDPYSMMAGIDESYAGACYIGYHSAAGSNGNPLSHTMSLKAQEIRVNGILASEFLLNAYTASSFGVPSLLLTGDAALCESARTIAPNIRVCPVISGLGGASISVHPKRARQMMADAVTDALQADPARMLVDLPDSFYIRITYLSTKHYLAHQAAFYPGAEKIDMTTVGFRSTQWIDVLTFIHFVL